MLFILRYISLFHVEILTAFVCISLRQHLLRRVQLQWGVRCCRMHTRNAACTPVVPDAMILGSELSGCDSHDSARPLHSSRASCNLCSRDCQMPRLRSRTHKSTGRCHCMLLLRYGGTWSSCMT